MLNKLNQLNEKDKRMLILGGIILGLILIYLLLVQPINHYKNQLVQDLQYNRSLLNLMQQAKQVSSKQPQVKHMTGSIATLLQQSFTVSKIKPTQVNITGDKAQVKFDHVVFDELAKWFVLLGRRYNLKVINVTIVRQPQSGIVAADVTIVPAASQ